MHPNIEPHRMQPIAIGVPTTGVFVSLSRAWTLQKQLKGSRSCLEWRLLGRSPRNLLLDGNPVTPRQGRAEWGGNAVHCMVTHKNVTFHIWLWLGLVSFHIVLLVKKICMRLSQKSPPQLLVCTSYLVKFKTTLSPLVIKRLSVHLTAALAYLEQFQQFSCKLNWKIHITMRRALVYLLH